MSPSGTKAPLSPLRIRIDRVKHHFKRCQTRHADLKEPISLRQIIRRIGTIVHGNPQCPSISCINDSDRIGEAQWRLANRGTRIQVIPVHHGTFRAAKLAANSKVNHGCRVRLQRYIGRHTHIKPTIRRIIGSRCIEGCIARDKLNNQGFHSVVQLDSWIRQIYSRRNY